jgi:hypothetical protein
MTNRNTEDASGQAGATMNVHSNGQPEGPPDLHLGPKGSVVLVGAELDLAAQMRRVAFPAVCWIDESQQIEAAADRRTVVVAYLESGTLAAQARTFIEQHFHPERVGVLDMSKMGFGGKADAFVPWWEDASGNGHYDDAPDFLAQCERRAEWIDRNPVIIDPIPDEDAVADPIGDIDKAAFHGPLGRLALATQPQTEASPVFVLAHLLAYFGTSVGRGPRFTVSATRHYFNLDFGLIGLSGSSRKGTAGDVATETWRKIDPSFPAGNITNGLNTGSGLLWELRDAVTKRGKDGEDVIVADAVADKRRVFLETEFASVLKQGHRENDPLSEYLRKFYDGQEVVSSKVRTDPVRVTGGHVSVVGHCTPADLEIYLTDADKANGLANRFIWLFGVRTKLLPTPDDVFGVLDMLGPALNDVAQALRSAKGLDEIRRDRAAETRWAELYRGEWANVPTGRLGSFFARTAPHVMRMAGIYAMADRSGRVRREHLDAAVAVWDHSARSLRFLFGADADPLAEKLLAALRAGPDEGLTKRQIANDVFSKHKDSETIDALLAKLLAYRLILAGEPISKGGRPAVRYRLNRW